MFAPRPTRWRGVLAALALLSAAPRSATAQTTDARRRHDEARASFEQAVRAFRAGSFAEAAAAFRRAQELAPHPATLFNLARAEERAGHVDAAVEAYDAYLAIAPTPPDADEVRHHVDALRPAQPPVPVPTLPVVPVVLPTPPPAVAATPAPTPPVAVPVPVVPELSLSERITQRRRDRRVSFRLGLITGFAAPRDRQNFAFGAEGSVFFGRSFTVLMHFLSIQTDGSPQVWTGEVGWTFAGGDFDIGVLAHAGVVRNCDTSCRAATLGTSETVFIGGVTLKVDVLFHPRVSLGLYGRFSWQNLDLLNGDALLSSLGLSVSLHL